VADASDVDETVLAAMLDRLIPAVNGLPAAGKMGLAPEVIRMAGGQPRFWDMFTGAMKSFVSQNPSFIGLDGDEQDTAISTFEADSPRKFSVLLNISYIVYYKDTSVHERIGWESRPPQPDGNVMEPWDESVLGNIRKREPFWRRV
jgi:hypothetical protein